MIPAIFWVLGHFSTNLVKSIANLLIKFEELTEAIIAAFHFPKLILGNWMSEFFIHVLNVVKVMHVVHEPSHLLRNLGLGLMDVVDDLNKLLSDHRQFTRLSIKFAYQSLE